MLANRIEFSAGLKERKERFVPRKLLFSDRWIARQKEEPRGANRSAGGPVRQVSFHTHTHTTTSYTWQNPEHRAIDTHTHTQHTHFLTSFSHTVTTSITVSLILHSRITIRRACESSRQYPLPVGRHQNCRPLRSTLPAFAYLALVLPGEHQPTIRPRSTRTVQSTLPSSALGIRIASKPLGKANNSRRTTHISRYTRLLCFDHPTAKTQASDSTISNTALGASLLLE